MTRCKVVVCVLVFAHLAVTGCSSKGTPGPSPGATKANELLLQAARAGQYERVVAAISDGADANAYDSMGWTALHHASIYGLDRMCQVLLDHGADVDARALPSNDGLSVDGVAPLHLAATNGNTAVVRLLLSHSANVEIEDGSLRRRPLHCAARGGHVPSAALLLGFGAEVDARNSGGETPLFDAAQAGSVGAVVLLFAFGADGEAVQNSGKTSLDYADLHGHSRTSQLIRFFVGQKPDGY